MLECYRNPPGALEHTPKKWFKCGAELGMECWSAKKEVKSWSATRTLEGSTLEYCYPWTGPNIPCKDGKLNGISIFGPL